MSNIDFVRMEYSLQLTFREEWFDARLAYKDTYPGRIVPKFIIITQREAIWMPDTFFMKYPMDKQTCNLDLASYAYTTEDLIYRWKNERPIQFHPLLNSSLPCFLLESANTGTCTSVTNTGEYSCIRTVFNLHRQFRQYCTIYEETKNNVKSTRILLVYECIQFFSYYLVQAYIPSTLLVIVSWVSFWLDRSAVPARVTLGVTTLLTMTTQAASINNSLPAVSYVKAIDIWIGICLSFIFAAVLEFAWVSFVGSMLESEKAKRKSDPHHSKPVDDQNIKMVGKPYLNNTDRRDSWGASKSGQDALSLLSKRSGAAYSAESPNRSWWKKWTHGADDAKIIDLKSRLIFPLIFILFNTIYWIWYSFL
uniref:Neur_chan_memb domain-containing protein n=1 Tax=Heterorhabditis bacteriophora TaxID=37862 RepID=A0A1I7XA14_HETBA